MIVVSKCLFDIPSFVAASASFINVLRLDTLPPISLIHA